MNTVAGKFYNISVWVRNDSNPGTFQNFGSLSFGGNVLGTLTNVDAFSYQQYTFNGVKATTAQTALTFSFRNDPGYFGVDDVSVLDVPGAVPEPATWAMMLIGFGMMGFGLRRRSNVKTTVSYA